jgi:3-hydroxybutyryl-CoA dehydratase
LIPSTINEYRWQDLAVGLRHEFHAHISEAMMKHFLEDFGDCNPLHIDESYAWAKGFKSRVVYGLLSSSLYSTLVGVQLPGKFCLLQGIDVSFVKPVFVADILTVSGEITYLNEAYRRVEIRAQIVNAKNEMVSKAKIKLGLVNEGT